MLVRDLKKQRLDLLVQQQFSHLTRNQIQSFIMQGKVSVEGQIKTKSGELFDVFVKILLDQEQPKYVCRAGYKLEKALEHFALDVHGKIVMDAGLSTGGFTDCLLQNGAQKVYGIDVGYGQAHEKIRIDPRVDVRERTNLRYVTSVGELVDLVTLDLSFISVLKCMEAVCAVLKPDGQLIVLVKPQFEARKEQVGKGGIIKDVAVHQEVIQNVTSGIVAYGFEFCGITESPIKGTEGNTEFLAYFKRCHSERSVESMCIDKKFLR